MTANPAISRIRHHPRPRNRRGRRDRLRPGGEHLFQPPLRFGRGSLRQAFTEETGITVNRIEGGADELIARLSAEGDNSPADIFLAVDAGRMSRAEEAGVLQPVDSEVIETRVIPPPSPSRRSVVRDLPACADHLLRTRTASKTRRDLRGPDRPGMAGPDLHPLVQQRLQPVASGLDHRNPWRGSRTDWAAGIVDNMARPRRAATPTSFAA